MSTNCAMCVIIALLVTVAHFINAYYIVVLVTGLPFVKLKIMAW